MARSHTPDPGDGGSGPSSINAAGGTAAAEGQGLAADGAGSGDGTGKFAVINELIRFYSNEAVVIFTALPRPPSSSRSRHANRYLKCVDALTRDLPAPVMCVRGVGNFLATEM